MIIGGRDMLLVPAPRIIGVVNLSPESPNQDSLAIDVPAAIDRARMLARGGAEIIDVGAQSSYYDAPLLSAAEEIGRLLPALRALKADGHVVSVDTFRPEVAAAAIASGADLINDSDGFQDPEMIEILGRWRGPVILPFISGPTPHDPEPFNFDDPVPEVLAFLRAAVKRATASGLRQILLDPGTGYRYPNVSAEQKERYQVKVYAALPRLRALGHPIVVALPRKESRQRTLELVGTILEGADYVRAHDPAIVREALPYSNIGGRV